MKIIASAILLLAAAFLTVALSSDSQVTVLSSEGIIIDYDEYNTEWAPVDLKKHSTARDAVAEACSSSGHTISFDADGTISEIDGIYSNGTFDWKIWIIDKGSTEWTGLSTPYDQTIAGTTAISVAYRASGELPTIAVDMLGSSVYGFEQKSRTITLAPALTEMMASVGGITTLVGTDKFSNYPSTVVKRQNSGDIAIVGDYTNPSYEAIVKVKPDIVFCDGSQYNHTQLSQRLKEVDICTIVLYESESIEMIRDNIFLMGTAMGYDIAVKEILSELDYAVKEIESKLDSPYATDADTMISLSGDMSPWVSGRYTYAHDALIASGGSNVFAEMNGWSHINSEQIVKRNPSVIIILTSEYKATQSEYDALIASLSDEWKGTDAYKDGEIYILTEEAGDMAQRPGPRYAQLTELTSRILNPGVFDDFKMPKYIGDNYRDYLTYTKNLGFEG